MRMLPLASQYKTARTGYILSRIDPSCKIIEQKVTRQGGDLIVQAKIESLAVPQERIDVEA